MPQLTDSKAPIQALKKVSLSIKAGTFPGGDDLIAQNTTMDLIFGLGIEGLTPFEFLLSDHIEGSSFSIKLKPHEVCPTFQHITLPLFDCPDSTEYIFFSFTVIKIKEADNREVIKAMAELSSCSGGSCDCCGH